MRHDLILVRHGQSEWNEAGRWQGQADPPLTPFGERQARDIAEHVSDIVGAAATTSVVSSDLVRAHVTATTIATRLGATLELQPLLREIDIGSFSGRTRAQIVADDPTAMEAYFRGEQGWTGGETFEAHELRSARALEALAVAAERGPVVAVSHGVTIRAITRELLGMPHGERWRMTGPGNCGLVHFERGRLGWRLVAYNAIAEPTRD
jgi:probable phosphoglycerate mutase